MAIVYSFLIDKKDKQTLESKNPQQEAWKMIKYAWSLVNKGAQVEHAKHQEKF